MNVTLLWPQEQMFHQRYLVQLSHLTAYFLEFPNMWIYRINSKGEIKAQRYDFTLLLSLLLSPRHLAQERVYCRGKEGRRRAES